MEYQYIDSNMDMYITKFKNKSLLLKGDKLRKGNDDENEEFDEEELNDDEEN